MSAVRATLTQLAPVLAALGSNGSHQRAPGDAPLPETLAGNGPLMQAVFRRIALVAPTRANVLIFGEPGTEAPAVARAVHAHSPRRTGPFVSVRATDVDPDRVAAVLCGDTLEPDNGGVLADAAGGTVFLDDLAAIPLAAQARLLPLIDRHEIVPVGALTGRPADVRVIAGVADPVGAIRAGRLRQDLVARLNVYQIAVPPLRDRITDLPELVDHLLRALGAPPTVRLTPAAMVALQTRPWPGNVRELRDVLALALARAGPGPVAAKHLPPPAVSVATAARLRALVSEWVRDRAANNEEGLTNLHADLLGIAEPALLAEVLRQFNGRRLPASRRLGMSRATLRKMAQALWGDQSD